MSDERPRRAANGEFVPGRKQRSKKRKPLDVIPVRVAQQNIRDDRLPIRAIEQ